MECDSKVTERLAGLFLGVVTMTMVWLDLAHSNACYPCICYPDDRGPSLLICQDITTTEFPTLPEYISSSILQILIVRTFIVCPGNSKSFTKLQSFEEGSNDFLNCTCIEAWRMNHPEAYFVSDCIGQSTSSITQSDITFSSHYEHDMQTKESYGLT